MLFINNFKNQFYFKLLIYIMSANTQQQQMPQSQGGKPTIFPLFLSSPESGSFLVKQQDKRPRYNG